MHSHDLSGPKALIIEDESDSSFLLSNILKQRNIQSVSAGSLKETDSIIESTENFRYIFLDNHLPDGLGMSYISRLKHRFPDTRLIMITAHDTHADKEKALKSGIDFFIGKPFSKENIFRTVDNSQI